MEENKVTVELSDKELRELEEYRAQKAKKELKERYKAEREAYRKLGESLVDEVMPQIEDLHNHIRDVKASVYSSFSSLLESKAELFGTK